MGFNFKKNLMPEAALVSLLFFCAVFFYFFTKQFFGQGFRKYSIPSNTAPFAEGPGPAGEARVLAASQPKDPLVNVKPKDLDGKPLVDFSRLAGFNCGYPDGDGGMHSSKKSKRKKPVIPNSVLSLNGTEVAIPGFMIPMGEYAGGYKTTYFILARNQMTCCFGVAPALNEWVSVRMEKGMSADLEMDRPVVAVGTLDVGEIYNADSGWSFYRMKGLKVIVAGKKKTWF